MQAGARAWIVRGAIDRATVAHWRAAIDSHPAWTTRAGDGFIARASSLQLGAVPALAIDDLAPRAWRSAQRADVPSLLAGDVAVAADACWVRRQYAPDRYPPRHAPHAWHQDGALGRTAGADETLIPMLTCWIALDACGDDAPAIELATDAAAAPSDPTALAGWKPCDTWRPELVAGDAIVFTGDVFHRTHVTAGMKRDRTSVELRYVSHTPDHHCRRVGQLRRFET